MATNTCTNNGITAEWTTTSAITNNIAAPINTWHASAAAFTPQPAETVDSF